VNSGRHSNTRILTRSRKRGKPGPWPFENAQRLEGFKWAVGLQPVAGEIMHPCLLPGAPPQVPRVAGACRRCRDALLSSPVWAALAARHLAAPAAGPGAAASAADFRRRRARELAWAPAFDHAVSPRAARAAFPGRGPVIGLEWIGPTPGAAVAAFADGSLELFDPLALFPEPGAVGPAQPVVGTGLNVPGRGGGGEGRLTAVDAGWAGGGGVGGGQAVCAGTRGGAVLVWAGSWAGGWCRGTC
jgi:hypothetical protein